MPILLNFVSTKAQNVEDIYRPPELIAVPEPPLPLQSGSGSGLLSKPNCTAGLCDFKKRKGAKKNIRWLPVFSKERLKSSSEQN